MAVVGTSVGTSCPLSCMMYSILSNWGKGLALSFMNFGSFCMGVSFPYLISNTERFCPFGANVQRKKKRGAKPG